MWFWGKFSEEKGEKGSGETKKVKNNSTCFLSSSPQTQVATKRQKVITEFTHLSQFLEEQQGVLLAQLEILDEDLLKQRDEFDVLATGEICRFSSLITELEEKSERTARELLTVRSEHSSATPTAGSPLTYCIPTLPKPFLHFSHSRIPSGRGVMGPEVLDFSSCFPGTFCSLCSLVSLSITIKEGR